MRTTVRLDESLLLRAKREAARRGTTLTALIEQGLRLTLRQPPQRAAAHPGLPVSSCRGGTLPGVDIDRSADLLDRMEALR